MIATLLFLWCMGQLRGPKSVALEDHWMRQHLSQLVPRAEQVWIPPVPGQARQVRFQGSQGQLLAYALLDHETYSDGLEERHWVSLYIPIAQISDVRARAQIERYWKRRHWPRPSGTYRFVDQEIRQWCDDSPVVSQREGYALQMGEKALWFDLRGIPCKEAGCWNFEIR